MRKVVSVILILLCLLFAWETLTVPMVSATAPAILMLACGVGAWLVWPRHSRSKAGTS